MIRSICEKIGEYCSIKKQCMVIENEMDELNLRHICAGIAKHPECHVIKIGDIVKDTSEKVVSPIVSTIVDQLIVRTVAALPDETINSWTLLETPLETLFEQKARDLIFESCLSWHLDKLPECC